jgi:hypothetical protein
MSRREAFRQRRVDRARTAGLLIEIHCRICGKPFSPTADDVRRGPQWYRRCPNCRVDGVAEDSA